MKSILQTIAVGLGITTICLLWVVNPLLDSSHHAIYHWSGSASTIYLPAILDFCGFWLLQTLVLLIAQRYERFQLYLWTSITVLLPWIVLKNAAFIYTMTFPHWVSRLLLTLLLITLLLLLTRWRGALCASFERLQHLMVTMFCFVSIIGLLILGQLFWFARQARGLNSGISVRPLRHTATCTPTRTRVVWILLDELSYQQVYEQRLPGLKLPAFDQLAEETTVFTHVIPAGIMTEDVLPSLMTGEPIINIRSSSSGQLFTQAPSGAWKNFDQHQTIFQDALNAGYNTGITGWYNPYCRILPNVLDSCFWIFSYSAKNHISPSFSIRENLMAPFRRGSRDENRLHAEDFRKLSREADSMLRDSSLDFILLHMPVPHPYGIYNRTTGNFATEPTSYIDNLALADRYLAHVREILERSGEWDASAIIVMGDHSWRTQLIWLKSEVWSREDQLASHGGQFDDRPAYIVKLPHQHQSARIDSPFNAVRTRQLLDAIIKNQITSQQSLAAWAR